MKRLALTAAFFATVGLATAVSAGESTQVRSHSVQGRNLVWSTPKAETPYALRGEPTSAKQAEKPRIELQSHGRAGTTLEVNRADER